MSMMGSLTIGREFSLTMMFVWMILASCVESEITKEREECTNQLIGLSTCLPYVGGESKAPTPDCCTSMKQVLVKSKKCLCILVRDRNDPTLGLKINATLALNVPSMCKSSASVADCPALLNLAPNSPAAQVFEQFEKSLHNITSKSSSGGSSSGGAVKSDGGRRRKSWLGMNVAVGLSLLSLASLVLLMSI